MRQRARAFPVQDVPRLYPKSAGELPIARVVREQHPVLKDMLECSDVPKACRRLEISGCKCSPLPPVQARGHGLLRLVCCAAVRGAERSVRSTPAGQAWIRVSDDKRSFVKADTGQAFVPWGFNYDHDVAGRLIEDYWDGRMGVGRRRFPGDEGPGCDRRAHPHSVRQVHDRAAANRTPSLAATGAAGRPGRAVTDLPGPDRLGVLPQAGRSRLV